MMKNVLNLHNLLQCMDDSKGSNVFELETTDDGQFYQAVRHAIVSGLTQKFSLHLYNGLILFNYDHSK